MVCQACTMYSDKVGGSRRRQSWGAAGPMGFCRDGAGEKQSGITGGAQATADLLLPLYPKNYERTCKVIDNEVLN